MLRARLSNGHFILGLDAENLRRLKDDKPIRVNLTDHGGTDTVLIVYGETLDEIVGKLTEIFGPMPPEEGFKKTGPHGDGPVENPP